MSESAVSFNYSSSKIQSTTIGQICDQFCGEVQTGPFGSQLHASDYEEVGTPVAMPQDLCDGRVTTARIARVGKEHVQRLRQHSLRAGDIVFSRRGDVARFAVITAQEEGWLCGTGCIRIRLNCTELDVGYLRWYLSQTSIRRWLEHNAKGVTMPNLNTSIVRALPLVYPPISEQRRIAAILDQADALRAKRREALALLDELQRGIFIDFLNTIKKESTPVALGSLAVNSRGAFVNGPFGSDLLTSELTEEGVPVVYIRDIRAAEYRRVRKICVSENKADQLSVCSVLPGDVLVAKVGDPPGIAAVYPDTEVPAIVTQDVIRIRPNLDLALPEFIQGYLNSSIGRIKIKEITVEATRARFSLGDFKKIIVELPPLPAQKVLANKLKLHQALVNSHRLALRELDALFVSLEDRAFRGKL